MAVLLRPNGRPGRPPEQRGPPPVSIQITWSAEGKPEISLQTQGDVLPDHVYSVDTSLFNVCAKEEMMANDHVKRIEAQIREYRSLIGKVAAPGPHEELIKIIHRQGWTTIAEGALVTAMLDSMIGTAKLAHAAGARA